MKIMHTLIAGSMIFGDYNEKTINDTQFEVDCCGDHLDEYFFIDEQTIPDFIYVSSQYRNKD